MRENIWVSCHILTISTPVSSNKTQLWLHASKLFGDNIFPPLGIIERWAQSCFAFRPVQAKGKRIDSEIRLLRRRPPTQGLESHPPCFRRPIRQIHPIPLCILWVRAFILGLRSVYPNQTLISKTFHFSQGNFLVFLSRSLFDSRNLFFLAVWRGFKRFGIDFFCLYVWIWFCYLFI